MDALDRLYARLCEIRRREAPGEGGPPLTIADVYQRLVPYRHVRGELGFSELKEYEHALLRLFSGEHGYLRVGQSKIVDEFRRELRSANPILGIYRDYATAEVELAGADPFAPGTTPADRDAGGHRVPPDETTADLAPVAAPPLLRRAESTEPTAPSPAERVHPPSRAAARCRSCEEPLPAGVRARFCPGCGAAQVPIPCRECSAPLEPAWRFCAQCGTHRQAPAAPTPAGDPLPDP